jgi:hypothetical protein
LARAALGDDAPPDDAAPLMRILEHHDSALTTLNTILRRELPDVPEEEWPDLIDG